MRTCIGIICIGEEYTKNFERTFKPSVMNYAARHGYDVRIFDSYLDKEHTHPDGITFQKCLVPEALLEYDVVVVMDADVWMCDGAPPFPFFDKVGIVDEASQVPMYSSLPYTDSPEKYYSLAGFDIQSTIILNTGVMVCRPSRHAQFFRKVYDKYIEKCEGHPRKFHYEQSCIGYELITQGMYELLPKEWNLLYCLYRSFKFRTPPAFAVHFAGLGAGAGFLQEYLAAQRPKGVLRWGIRQ